MTQMVCPPFARDMQKRWFTQVSAEGNRWDSVLSLWRPHVEVSQHMFLEIHTGGWFVDPSEGRKQEE